MKQEEVSQGKPLISRRWRFFSGLTSRQREPSSQKHDRAFLHVPYRTFALSFHRAIYLLTSHYSLLLNSLLIRSLLSFTPLNLLPKCRDRLYYAGETFDAPVTKKHVRAFLLAYFINNETA